VANQAAEALLKQILLDGFFHADPHPGNLFIQPPSTIVMLDAGMTGHLDKRTIIIIAKILRAANKKIIPASSGDLRNWEWLYRNR